MNWSASTSLYEATIPAQPAGTWVRFEIVAYDCAGNNATRDGTEPYCMYQVIPEFPSAIILPLFMVLFIIAVTATKRRFPRKLKKSSQNQENICLRRVFQHGVSYSLNLIKITLTTNSEVIK